MKDKIIATDNKHLISLIDNEIKLNGSSCDLNHIDVSAITNMKHLFSGLNFNGNVSQWNVSNVTDMTGMFSYSEFNGDVSQWDVSNVKKMGTMFESSKFNGDISSWNISSLEHMYNMFKESSFSQDLLNWKPYKLKSSNNAFQNTNASVPYWANYNDENERAKAIESYCLAQELTKDLSEKINVKKKLKL